MKKLLLAVFILFAMHVNAQVTITQNEMPGAGDELYRTRAGINPFLNYAATGANYVWNFPNLSATTQDSAIYQTVASTNFIYALTYIDFAFNPNRANHAKPGVDIPFNNLLPITDPYTFYYRNASVYKTVGFGVELAGIPVPIIFSDHDEIYSLPLNYGDTDTSQSAYNISIPALAYYGYEQTRMNEVDGWGVITTPSGTFDVLRVKTSLLGRDTINLDSLSIGFSIDRPLATEYKWLTPGLQIPVMQVNTTELFGIEIITDIFFYDLPRSINVVQPLASIICPGTSLTVPYDITGAFNAGGIFVPANIFRAQLSDMNGDFTNAVTIGSVTTNVAGTISCTIPANTPPGTGYRIRVISTNPAFTGNDNGFDITVGTAPVAVATAAGATEFCEGGSVILSAVTDPAYTYQWQLNGTDITSEINADLTAVLNGSYTVVVTNACGSETSLPIDVIVNPLPEHIFSQATVPACNNSVVSLLSQNTSGQTGLTYQWYESGNILTGEINDSLVTGTAGNYTLEILNPLTGCMFTAAVSVVIDSIAFPQVSVPGNLNLCPGDSVAIDVLPVSGVTYQWQLDGIDISGATSTSVTASTAGFYSVVATSAGGCTASSLPGLEVTIDTAPAVPVITATGTPVFCTGGSVQLDITPEPNVTYEWLLNGITIPGASGSTLIAADSGSYVVLATNSNGCTSASTPGFDVQVNPAPASPVITPGSSTVFCQGDSVVLSVVAVVGFNYQWTFNGTNIPNANLNQYTVIDSTGAYSVVVTDMNGCTAAATISYQVDIFPLPSTPVITQVNDTLYTTGSGNIQWYLDGILIPGATDVFYIPTVNGNYTVTVSDTNNCENISVIFPMTNVGINETISAIFSVYPNPSNGQYQIELNNAGNVENSITVFDPAGKCVYAAATSENMYSLNLSHAANGIYILKIQNASGISFVIKLIKQ